MRIVVSGKIIDLPGDVKHTLLDTSSMSVVVYRNATQIAPE